ncbi:MAG: AEC family transporter [Desulfamplus sp.]|nr:AEC family transporter [Desulfamplus sp.]
MENFAVIVTFLIIGMVLQHIPDFSVETGRTLNLFVIYISLPALVLLKIPELTFSSNLLVVGLMPWGMLFFSSGLILLLASIFKWEKSVTGSFLLVIPLGNTSFLGVPMVKTFFGDHAISYALLYDQLGSFLALATYGSLVIAFYGTAESRPNLKLICKKVGTFPPFIALITALLLKFIAISYPLPVINILKTLSSTLVPVAMVAVGFQLRLKIDSRLTSLIAIGLFIKLIAAPLVALAASKILGLEDEAALVSIFEAGMPPMVSAGAMAIIANLAPTLTAALVGIGIVLSFVTLPILYQLIISS